jgi:hypothetical protein
MGISVYICAFETIVVSLCNECRIMHKVYPAIGYWRPSAAEVKTLF